MAARVEVFINSRAATEIEAEFLVVPLFSDELNLARERSDGLSALLELALEDQFQGKVGSTSVVRARGLLRSRRVVFVGLGKRSDWLPERIRGAICAAAQAATARKITEMAVELAHLPTADGSTLQFAAQGAVYAGYRFDDFRSSDGDDCPVTLAAVTLLSSDDVRHCTRGRVLAQAVCRARDWINQPPCVCTPAYMAEQATILAEERGLECRIVRGLPGLRDENMNLFAAVARGSEQPPVLIHLIYRSPGSPPKQRFAFVGKGVTYDSGGYSMKPPQGQIGMHADMGGAAAVLGAADAISALAPQGVEVHFIVPSAENLVSAGAYKVNDIIFGRNGKSVEIANTDAEGRLLLADALCYAEDLGVDLIVDAATLTGANVVALGAVFGGVLSNHDVAVSRVLDAGRAAGEPLWRLPLPDRLLSSLKSEVADLKNVGGRAGGTLTAGLFLNHFVKNTPFVHLDIAGMARATEAWEHVPKGGTGFGVLTFTELVGA